MIENQIINVQFARLPYIVKEAIEKGYTVHIIAFNEASFTIVILGKDKPK